MNNIERQMLKNQREIMDFLLYPTSPEKLIEHRNDTDKLTNPKVKDESACDMSDLDEMDEKEDAFGGKKK